MAEIISGQVSSISKFLHQNPQAFGVTFSGNPTRDFERQFTSTDVTKLYFANVLVTTAPTLLDVTNLTDVYSVGNPINFTTIKHLQIVNNDPAINLTVGGGTNALLATLPVLIGQAGTGPGSCVNLTTNLAVSGTAKIIQLVAASGSISVDLFLVGN